MTPPQPQPPEPVGADPAPSAAKGRPEDYEPRTYGDITLTAVGPARVVFDALHADPNGGWGFAIKEHDGQAVAIIDALIAAGYRITADPPMTTRLPDGTLAKLIRWCPSCGGHMVIQDPWAAEGDEAGLAPCQCTEFGGLYRLEADRG